MTSAAPLPKIHPRDVVVFSGHMIDTPDRMKPRFPPSAETAIRDQIAAQLDVWDIGTGDLSISGAARGGDILFAEQCRDRGATVWLFLAKPVPVYLEESVRIPDSNWEPRFHALRRTPGVRTFLQSDFFPNPKDGLGVHERNNLWILDTGTALATAPGSLKGILVWDEKPTGNGPGGTSDFVARLRNAKAIVAPVIDPMPKR